MKWKFLAALALLLIAGVATLGFMKSPPTTGELSIPVSAERFK